MQTFFHFYTILVYFFRIFFLNDQFSIVAPRSIKQELHTLTLD